MPDTVNKVMPRSFHFERPEKDQLERWGVLTKPWLWRKLVGESTLLNERRQESNWEQTENIYNTASKLIFHFIFFQGFWIPL